MVPVLGISQLLLVVVTSDGLTLLFGVQKISHAMLLLYNHCLIGGIKIAVSKLVQTPNGALKFSQSDEAVQKRVPIPEFQRCCHMNSLNTINIFLYICRSLYVKGTIWAPINV